ncbi:aminotransferase class V-fold PLP-dependent enzyme [Anaerovorax odorimutans]|uniref:cysteine desulfurase n=1 Tax=Anaerovorax odorimutans TaxID=109327 RepID=A0ABT1RNW2_9FIRM|nr:aminotransferase class V-fold PLP-dependent enzyme [Anaerovorax odorimutans]MCQ4636888.1 aminotransferase class V-fold PLP-dependent enzyme [Anaerovorax odorimutans]
MIYLDNGATSFPKPKGMIEAMDLCMSSYCGNPGRSGHDLSRRTGEEVYQARKTLARFFKIEKPDRIIFTSNTTEALNIGIKGVLKSGDHVITTVMEHNSVLRPLRALADRGVEYTLIPCASDGSLDVSKVEDAIRENTRLIVCTQASNVTGTIMPVDELGLLCRNRGILFMVDGAQGAGHVPMDVRNMDLLAVPGHKGLLGPLGTGMLYVREGIELQSLMEGGTGTVSREIIQPTELPEGFETGTINAPGIIGLGYSAGFVNKIGVEVIRQHQKELTKILDQSLRNMKNVTVYGPSDCRKKVGIVTFNINGYNCEEVASLLNDEYGIAVRGGYHCAGLAHKTIGTWDCGAVRMSMGIYNNAREMKAAADAIYAISKS